MRFLLPTRRLSDTAASACVYSAEEIAALMSKARRLRPALRAATAETVVGLLTVTGMRSDVVRLNQSDVDLTASTLGVVATKGSKSRELAPHGRRGGIVQLHEAARRRVPRRQLTELLRVEHRSSAGRAHPPCHLQALGAGGRAGAAFRVESSPSEAS